MIISVPASAPDGDTDHGEHGAGDGEEPEPGAGQSRARVSGAVNMQQS